ncbi:hypothetical protein, partial [Microcystis aeruginosa]|uniref:hypothetical protein n=1 Tax=Microcystis aeruginosa TaxID=1126 RepID=UPI0023306880
MIIILISELSVIFLLFIRSSGFGRQDSVVSSQEIGDRRQETEDRRQEIIFIYSPHTPLPYTPLPYT